MQEMMFSSAAKNLRKSILDGTIDDAAHADRIRDMASRLIQSRWRSKLAKRKMLVARQAKDDAVLAVYAVRIQRAFRIRRELRRRQANRVPKSPLRPTTSSGRGPNSPMLNIR
jgi:hypothetical protein